MTFSPRKVCLFVLLFAAAAACHSVGQTASKTSSSTSAVFPPVEQWKNAVLSGNVTALRALYSTDPAPRVITVAGESSVDADLSFWTGLKVKRMKVDIIESKTPQTGLQQVAFEAEVHSTGAMGGESTQYIIEAQLWQQQGAQWRLVGVQRQNPTRLQQPTSTTKIIYAPGLDAHAEIKQALATAAKEHKRVILVFGANWCYDCHVLDLAFHRPDLEGVLEHNYEVVHIDVGEGDKNQDIMQQYQVPMKKGIPALAVLDSGGKLLYSQQGGEFEKARSLAPQDLLAFLNKWKPTAK
jgi:thioredoxin 1